MILNTFSLEGKVVVAAGCDTGPGQGMALGLTQAGCNIVGIGVAEPTGTTEQVTTQGCRFLSLAADLREIDGISGLLDRAIAEFGHIDILVNNAGLVRRGGALGFSETDWGGVTNLNTKSVFFMSQVVMKHSIARDNGDRIINIASMLSLQDGICVPSYTAPESGVMGATRLVANEQARHNININAITPGYMMTNNTQRLRVGKQRSAEILDRIPADRWGLPSDLTGPVVFPASNAPGHINGCTIAVDGGWLTCQLIPPTFTTLPHDRVFCICRSS